MHCCLCVVWTCFLCSMSRLRIVFFFFKQKTAYEMRISDWSSDVCSSDLGEQHQRLSAERSNATRDPLRCGQVDIRDRNIATGAREAHGGFLSHPAAPAPNDRAFPG